VTFDAELYLRMAGERALLTSVPPGHWQPDGAITETAAALVVADALDAETAQTVVDEYSLARSIRGNGGGHVPRWPRHTGPMPAPVPMTPPRVVACNRDLDQSWGRLRVHSVVLGDRATSVAFSAFESSPGALMQRMSAQGGLAAPQVSLTDDRGRTETAHVQGGGVMGGAGLGQGATFQGRLTTMSPLSRTTRWVELPEGRIELGDECAPQATVRVESLPPASPANRYLFRRLVGARQGFFPGQFPGPPVSIEHAVAALVAAGALAPDEPVIDTVRAIASDKHPGTLAPGSLPSPWASYLSRLGVQGGPDGAVAVAAVTPPIDGIIVAVDTLLSAGTGFGVHAATSPGTLFGPVPYDMSVKDPRVAWWAEDNLGNHYLGGSGGWGGGPDVTEGTVGFFPALDASATELHLQPTLTTERAVITVRLPDWETIT
jgi:hypothetical protein